MCVLRSGGGGGQRVGRWVGGGAAMNEEKACHPKKGDNIIIAIIKKENLVQDLPMLPRRVTRLLQEQQTKPWRAEWSNTTLQVITN